MLCSDSPVQFTPDLISAFTGVEWEVIKCKKGSEGGEWKRGGKREEEGGKCLNLA